MHLETLNEIEPDFIDDNNVTAERLNQLKMEFLESYGNINFDGIYFLGVATTPKPFDKPDLVLLSHIKGGTTSLPLLSSDTDSYNHLIEILSGYTTDEFQKSQIDSAYDRGREDGYQAAYSKGYLLGKRQGKVEGFDAGKLEANKKREELNKTDVELSYRDGYYKGYDDGKNDR